MAGFGPEYGNNNIVIQDDGNLFCDFKASGDQVYRYHLVDGINGQILWSSREKSQTLVELIGPDDSIYGYKNTLFRIDSKTGVQTDIRKGLARPGAITQNKQIENIGSGVTRADPSSSVPMSSKR